MNFVDKIKMDVERSKRIKFLKEKYSRPLVENEDVSFIDIIIDTEDVMDSAFVYGYDTMYGWYTIRKIIVKAAIDKDNEDVLRKKKKNAAKKKNKKIRKYKQQVSKLDEGYLPVVRLSSGAITTLSREEFKKYESDEKVTVIRWTKQEDKLLGGGYQVFVETYDFVSYDEDDYDIMIDVVPLFQMSSTLNNYPFRVVDFRSSTVVIVTNVEEYCVVIRALATGKPISIVKNILNLPKHWRIINLRSLVRFKKKNYIPSLVEVVKEYEVAYSQDELEYAYTRFYPHRGPLEKKSCFSFNFGSTTRCVKVEKGILTFKTEVFTKILKPTFCTWSWHHVVSYYVYYEEDYKFLSFLCWFFPLFFCGDTVVCDKLRIVSREKLIDVKPTYEDVVLFLTRMAVVRFDAEKLLDVLLGSIRADYEYVYAKEGNIDSLIEQAKAFAIEIMKVL